MADRHFNFADLFELAADTVPDRVAVVDRRRRVTYAELEARANRLAHALQDVGVKPGQHVGILATNCIEWVEAMVAAYKIRASVVNVNFRYVEERCATSSTTPIWWRSCTSAVRPDRGRSRDASQAPNLLPHRMGRLRRRRSKWPSSSGAIVWLARA